EDFAELVRALPRDGECADAAAADAADGAAGGVVAQFVAFFDFGKDLLEQEPRVLIRERVVFKTAVRLALSSRSRRDEYADNDRQFALRDHVVEDCRDVVLRALPVLKDHHAGRSLRFVLRGDIYPPVAGRALEDFAGPFRLLNQFAFWDAGLLPGFGRS